MSKKEKPPGLDQAWLDDTTLRVVQLARQLATGQPVTHAQFRQLAVAATALTAALVHAGTVGEETDEE